MTAALPIAGPCPQCQQNLTQHLIDGIEVDHCLACGGTFLDRGEARELLGVAADIDSWRGAPMCEEAARSVGRCPRDDGDFRGFKLRWKKREVCVDVCNGCSGLWLERGEGRALHDLVLQAGQDPSQGLADKQGVMSYLFQLATALPREVWHPTRRRPWLTWALLALLTAIMALELKAFGGPEDAPLHLFFDRLILIPADILSGQGLWALISYMFLHAGLGHLAGNLYFLWIFGNNIESALGRMRFVQLFLVTGIAAALFEVLLSANPEGGVVGASGAIAGLMGAYLALFPQVRLYIVAFFIRFRLPAWSYLIFWIAINILQALNGVEGVAWYAHIGGFLSGFVIGYCLRPRPLNVMLQRMEAARSDPD